MTARPQPARLVEPGSLAAPGSTAGLKGSYRRLALISHRNHVAAAAQLPDTLIVSTDWLAWRHLRDQGRDAIHFEAMLDTWPEGRGEPGRCHERHGAWVYLDGADATLFHGMSLGKTLIRAVSLSMNAFERLWFALDRACARWTPEEIVHFDLRAELDLVTEPMKALLVRELAARHGARLTDRRAAVPPGDPGFPERLDGYLLPVRETGLRPWLRTAFTECLDAACRLRDLARRRTPVLVVSNTMPVLGILAEARTGRPVAPAVLPGHLPKTPGVLLDWFRRGVVLVSLPPARLGRADRAAVAAIRDRFAAAWRDNPPADPIEAARRLIVAELLDNGWLDHQASAALQWRRVFARRRFLRAVVGDATNDACRLVIEAAGQAGVPVDELPNGMFVTSQRYEARCGDAHQPPALSRLLSWGPQTDLWLRETGAGIASVRVGYPALDALRRPAAAAGPVRRALVLPIYADADDTPALTSNIFATLVEVVAALQARGCPEIRVKLHSGPQNLDYYRAVLAHHGLTADIIKGGPLAPHADWADVVVGPVNSGAFIETLALGKRYVPIRPEPSLISRSQLGPVPVVDGAAGMSHMLDDDGWWSRDAILGHFCEASPDGASAAARMWRVFEQDREEQASGHAASPAQRRAKCP